MVRNHQAGRHLGAFAPVLEEYDNYLCNLKVKAALLRQAGKVQCAAAGT